MEINNFWSQFGLSDLYHNEEMELIIIMQITTRGRLTETNLKTEDWK